TRLASALDVESVEIGIAASLRGEHYPTPVRRKRRIVVEPRMIGQAPRRRAPAREIKDVPIAGPQRRIDDAFVAARRRRGRVAGSVRARWRPVAAPCERGAGDDRRAQVHGAFHGRSPSAAGPADPARRTDCRGKRPANSNLARGLAGELAPPGAKNVSPFTGAAPPLH